LNFADVSARRTQQHHSSSSGEDLDETGSSEATGAEEVHATAVSFLPKPQEEKVKEVLAGGKGLVVDLGLLRKLSWSGLPIALRGQSWRLLFVRRAEMRVTLTL